MTDPTPEWVAPELDELLNPDAPMVAPDEGDDSSRGDLPHCDDRAPDVVIETPDGED